jgi:hypothetical protein
MVRVLEKRVLKKTCRLKRGEVTGEWKRLYKEELCDLYSQIFFRVDKSRRMKEEWHVALWGRRQMHTESLWGDVSVETT